jgi:hypothetical protein
MAISKVSVGAALLLAVAFAWPASASACEGTDVVFEDKFADDAGGWAINKDVEVMDGSFTFKLPPDAMQSDLNVTYSVNDADICAESVWPDGDASVLGAGLLFWGEDNRNYLQFGVLTNGKFWIARRIEGKWHTIVENLDSSAIKVKPGETNVLRVKAAGDTASFFINGEKVRDLRGQAPKGGWRFGLSADNFDKDKTARLVFKSVKVTN